MEDGGCKYDVFISYSRKDFIRENGEIIPDNVISKILSIFSEHHIVYWFDREGIYHGAKFVPLISEAIINSKMLVFVSSEASNASKWTAGEVFEALDHDKLIIPFRIDNAPYNSSFRLLVRPLDYIDYRTAPQSALDELVRAVNTEKEKFEEKRREREQELLEGQTREEIKVLVTEYLKLEADSKRVQETIVQKNAILGRRRRVCPVCGSEQLASNDFCQACGWMFHPLEQLRGEKDFPDALRLHISRSVWKHKESSEKDQRAVVSGLQEKLLSQEKEVAELKASLERVRQNTLSERGRLENMIASLTDERDSLMEKIQEKDQVIKSYQERARSQRPVTQRATTSSKTVQQQAPLDKKWVQVQLSNIIDSNKLGDGALFSSDPVSRVDLRRTKSDVEARYGVSIALQDLRRCKTVKALRDFIINKIV